MAGLVRCKVCGRRFAEDAAREICGKLCCPPCYGKLVARLKEKKASQSGPRPAAKPAAKPASSPSERLAKRAGMAPGLGQGGELPDLPDMPEDLGPETKPWRLRRGPVFSIGPAALGRGFYAALLGAALYAGSVFAAGGPGKERGGLALSLMGAAAAFGVVALILGLFEAIKGGERPKQVCGGLALAAGLILAGYGGKKFYGTLGQLKLIDMAVDTPGKEKPKPGDTKKPEPEKPSPEKPEPKKPEPEKPEPEKPEPSPEEKLRAEIKSLLAETAQAAQAASPELGALGVIRKESIAGLEYILAKDGRSVTGIVEVRLSDRARSYPFQARKVGDSWQISSIDLVASAHRAERTGEGKWKLVEVETADPVIRYRRALRGLDAAALPAAEFGLKPERKLMAGYAELRMKGAKPRKISEKGRGLILTLGREARFSEILDEARQDLAHRPVAVLVVGGKGPIFPLPRITTKEIKASFKTVVVELAARDEGGKQEFVLRFTGLKLKADRKGLAALGGRMKQLRQVGKMPVKIVPGAEVPLELLVGAVNACLKAGFKVEGMTIDPGKSKPDKG